MVTFDQWLLGLVKDGTISIDDAMQAVSSRHDFQLAMQQAGLAVPRRTGELGEEPPADEEGEAPGDEPADALEADIVPPPFATAPAAPLH